MRSCKEAMFLLIHRNKRIAIETITCLINEALLGSNFSNG